MQQELPVLEKNRKSAQVSMIFFILAAVSTFCSVNSVLSDLKKDYIPAFGVWQNFDFYLTLTVFLGLLMWILFVGFVAVGVVWTNRISKLFLSSDGLVCRAPGATLKTTWNNVIGVKLASQFGGNLYALELQSPAEVEPSSWWTRRLRWPIKQIQISLFINWPGEEGFALLEPYIPQIVESWRRYYRAGGREAVEAARNKSRLIRIVVVALITIFSCILGVLAYFFLRPWFAPVVN